MANSAIQEIGDHRSNRHVSPVKANLVTGIDGPVPRHNEEKFPFSPSAVEVLFLYLLFLQAAPGQAKGLTVPEDGHCVPT